MSMNEGWVIAPDGRAASEPPAAERTAMSTAPADVSAPPSADVVRNPVTRVEILDVLEGAFADGAASRGELLEIARAHGARSELLALLEALPDRHYTHQRNLWVDLPHVPVGL